MAHLSGDKIGKEVCMALGLDFKNISRIDILLRANDVAKVEITRFVKLEEIGKVKEILEKYEVTKVKETIGG